MVLRLVSSAVVLAALGSTACAGSARPGEAPGDDLAALLDDLSANERRIEDELGPVARSQPGYSAAPGASGGFPAHAGASPAADAPAPPPAAPASAPSVEEAEGADRDDAPRASGSPCGTACRALGSMRRSAERICELVPTDDARCLDARRRTDSSAARVAASGCGCAGGS